MLRVTFDTNVLDFACRPRRFSKNPQQPLMKKVHKALVERRIEGFYSVTMLTIEGVVKKDRARVYSGTHLVAQREKIEVMKNADLSSEVREIVGARDVEGINLEFTPTQPGRGPLPPEVIARVKAAKAIGVKVLRDVPCLGAFQYRDPTGEWYLSTGEGVESQSWGKKSL